MLPLLSDAGADSSASACAHCSREPRRVPFCGFGTPGGLSTGSLPNPQTIPPYSKRSFLLEDFKIHLSASQQFPTQTRPKGLVFWGWCLVLTELNICSVRETRGVGDPRRNGVISPQAPFRAISSDLGKLQWKAVLLLRCRCWTGRMLPQMFREGPAQRHVART